MQLDYIKKTFDGNYTRTLFAVWKKSSKQNLMKKQL